jgi:hypothetical protein
MSLWRKLFAKGGGTPLAGGEDLTGLASTISKLIDGLAHDIFMEHVYTFLREPIDYVVPGVWGAKKSGSLTPEQKRIHAVVQPVVEEIFRHLALRGLSEPQRFALDFLIRGLIINRLTYTIEAARARGLGPGKGGLADLETVGNA